MFGYSKQSCTCTHSFSQSRPQIDIYVEPEKSHWVTFKVSATGSLVLRTWLDPKTNICIGT